MSRALGERPRRDPPRRDQRTPTLYRQAEIYARDGLDLPRGLLAGGVGKSAELAEL